MSPATKIDDGSKRLLIFLIGLQETENLPHLDAGEGFYTIVKEQVPLSQQLVLSFLKQSGHLYGKLRHASKLLGSIFLIYIG